MIFVMKVELVCDHLVALVSLATEARISIVSLRHSYWQLTKKVSYYL